jgi:arylsulfatase A-like enzyme
MRKGPNMSRYVGFSVLLAVAAAIASRAAPQPRNIILAMTDDQGWADVGYQGNAAIRTPVLDEMAARGIRFDRFYAAAPVCSPTRASCMTGRHPNRSGVFSWGYDLPLAEVTLAEILREAGFATGHFGKWHLGGLPEPPEKAGRTNRSKVQHAKPPHPGNQGFDEWASVFNFFDLNPDYFVHNGERVGAIQGDGSDITVDFAVKWIRAMAAKKQRFFAVVWFGNPHLPHQALPKDAALYPDAKPPMQHYMGEISGVDRAMGTLRTALREAGVADDTLLWFCSDNGGKLPHANNGGLRGEKGNIWEGGFRVPGILEWPSRVPKPVRTSVPACTSDFLPTILDLLGLKPPDARPLDGISLVPLIDGTMRERPSPIAFEIRNDAQDVRAAALTDNRFKLVVTEKGKKGPSVELFDLGADMAEEKDVAAAHADVVAAMRAKLAAWQESVVRSLSGADYAAGGK